VLPDGVIQHNFLNGVILHVCYVHGHRKDFIQGEHHWIFPNVFLGSAKNSGICFLPFKTKKTGILAEIFKFLLPSDTHACV